MVEGAVGLLFWEETKVGVVSDVEMIQAGLSVRQALEV